jgi:transcriptional regulator with XRE-family HTH domain
MKKSRSWSTILLLIALVTFLTSCGTLFTKGGSDYRKGKDAYEKKAYAQSLVSLQNALITNPELEEADLLFPIVFREGTTYYKDIISANASKDNPDATDAIYFAYGDMQSLHRTAQNSGRKGLTIEDFAKELEASRLKTAEVRFAYGESLEAENKRSSTKAAVAQYEIVKKRNSEFPDIDARIAQAVKKATVSLLVVGLSENTSFNENVTREITACIRGNRYVTVASLPTSAYDSMVADKYPEEAAIKYAQDNNIGYLISVKETRDFEKISENESLLLPIEMPIFAGSKRSVGYSVLSTLSYKLIQAETSKVLLEDKFEDKYNSPRYEYSFVGSEGLKEVNGMKSRYITLSPATTEEQFSIAYSKLYGDYYNIPVPAGITIPSNRSQWDAYYKKTYSTLESLAKDTSGKEFFYDPEIIIKPDAKTFNIIGSDTQQGARDQEEVRSAIMNARSRRATDLITEANKTKYDKFNAGPVVKLGEKLNEIF